MATAYKFGQNDRDRKRRILEAKFQINEKLDDIETIKREIVELELLVNILQDEIKQ